MSAIKSRFGPLLDMHVVSLITLFFTGSAAIAAPSLDKARISIPFDYTDKAPSEIFDHELKPPQLNRYLPADSPRIDFDETFYLKVSSSDPVNHGPNYAFYGFFASRWGVHGELGYESVFKLENRRLVHEGLVVDYSPLRLWPPMTALTYAADSHADFEFQAVQHNVGGKTVYYLEFLGPGRSPFFSFSSLPHPTYSPAKNLRMEKRLTGM